MEQAADGPLCSKHDRLIEYFCTDDHEAICSRCYIMGDHKGHTIESFEEKNKSLITLLENEIETATVVFNNLSKIDTSYITQKLRLEKRNLVEKVTQSFDHLHNVLKRREKQIIDEIYDYHDVQKSLIDGQVENAKNATQKLEKALTDSRFILENQSLVIDGENLLQTISAAPDIPCIAANLTSHLKWDSTHTQDIADAIRSFGTVKGNKEENICFKTIKESPEEIKDADKILKIPLNTQKSCDTHSISSIDTGEDVIIESDTDSIISTTTTMSSLSNRSSGNKEIILPQVKGTVKQISVTHIRSPNDFYVQLLVNKSKLENLSRNINVWCCRKSSALKQVPLVLEIGMHVLACYSEDKQWYRAQVIDVDVSDGEGDGGMKAHVIYYDFGNEEKVPIRSLRKMEKRFSQYPQFAVHCSLFDIAPLDKTFEWDNNAIQEFFRITHNQILLLNVIVIKGLTYEVDLICMPTEDVLDDQFSSVRDMLIFLDLAKFSKPSQPSVTTGKPVQKTVNYYKPTSIANGDTFQMTVSEATSPSDFYIMPNGEENLYYLNMMAEMKEIYEKDSMGLYVMHCPHKDAVCVVKGPDNKWHRGKIVSATKRSTVTVFLTDTGSTIVVHYDKIKKLLSNFIKLPSQAIHCKLADIDYTDPVEGKWSDDAKTWCRTDLMNSQGIVRIVRWGELTEIVLWIGIHSTSESVNHLLVEAGLAVSTGLSSLPLNLNRQIDAVPSKASVKPTKDCDKATRDKAGDKARCRKTSSNSLSTLSIISSPSSSIASPSKDTSSTALPKEKSKSSSTPSTPTKSNIDKNLRSKNKSKKCLELEPHKSDEEKANDFASEAETARKRKMQEDIHRAMEGTSEETGNSKPDGLSTYIEITVCCYKSPTDFFIRVHEQEGALLELMQKLDQEYNDSVAVPEQKWNAEDFCVVKYVEKRRWCRGKINSIISSTVGEVELLDYGNIFETSLDDLRPLAPDHGTQLNRTAVRCYLASLIPTGTCGQKIWTQTAIEFMENVISSKKLYIKTEGDPSDAGLPIDIIVEEEIPETAFDPVIYTYYSLRQKMVDEGLAMFDKPRKRTTVSSSTLDSSEKLSDKEGWSQEAGSTESMSAPSDVELPPYTIPDLNAEIEVIPTYVDFSGVIYAQRTDWDAQIAHLSEELQRVYKDSPPIIQEWSLGDVCVAYFPDDEMWYRGMIEELAGIRVKIFYVDFGNSAWVEFDKLRSIQIPFVKYPIQVYHCVLEDLVPNTPDGQWPVALLDVIHEMVVNCHCTMVYTGMQDNGHLKIKLQKAKDFDLATYLLNKGYTISTMDLKDRFANSQSIGAALSSCALCGNSDVGEAGSVFHAVATEVELPNIVYVQRMRMEEANVHDFVRASEIAAINNEISQFENMMDNVKSTPSSGFIKLPDVGLVCLGKYHFDNNWYRALCVEKYPETDSCLVVFIDYGTSEIVSRDCLRSLPSQFWDIPSQGIRCHINLIPPGGPNSVWRKDSLDAMVISLSQKQLTVKVVQSEPLTVELLVETEGRDLCLAYEDVIQKGLAWLPMQIDMSMLFGRDGDGMKQSSDDVEVVEDNWYESVEGSAVMNKNTNNNGDVRGLVCGDDDVEVEQNKVLKKGESDLVQGKEERVVVVSESIVMQKEEASVHVVTNVLAVGNDKVIGCSEDSKDDDDDGWSTENEEEFEEGVEESEV